MRSLTRNMQVITHRIYNEFTGEKGLFDFFVIGHYGDVLYNGIYIFCVCSDPRDRQSPRARSSSVCQRLIKEFV